MVEEKSEKEEKTKKKKTVKRAKKTESKSKAAEKPAEKAPPEKAPSAKEEQAPSKEKQTPTKEEPTKEVSPKTEPVKPEAVKKPEKKPEKKGRRKSKAKKAKKVFVARGKRKESVARATIYAGKGSLRLNSVSVSVLSNKYVREIIREPLRYLGPEVNTVDIRVNVNGGGTMGQAQAARVAISRALAMYFDEMNLREKFIDIDRSLIIEDTRRVEIKKDCGPKARAKYQKSYR